MKYQKQSVLAALFLMGTMGAASAATVSDGVPATQLDDYVVTATRIKEQAPKVPSLVTVITAQQIADHNYTSVRQAIQNVPGLFIDRNAQGGIAMRGYDSKNILVLVDGVQVNDTYTGNADLNYVPIDNVKKIEVTQGAGSSLYGGHAVAGVINIITDTANKAGVHGNVVLSQGTYNTWKRSVKVDANVHDKWDFGVSYEKEASDGYRGFYRATKPSAVQKGKPDLAKAISAEGLDLPKLSDGTYIVGGRGEKAWEHENTSAYVTYYMGADKSLKYRFTSSLNTYQYDNPFSYVLDKQGKEVFSGNVKLTDTTYLDLKPSRFLGYVGLGKTDTHSLNYNDGKNHVLAHAYYVNNYRSGFSSPAAPTRVPWTGAGDYSYHPGKTYDVGVEKTWDNLDKHIVVAGLNWHKEDMVQKRFNMTDWQNLNSVTNLYAEDHGSTTGTALYVQDKYMPNTNWAVYTGFRLDHFTKNDGRLWNKEGQAYDTAVPSESYTHVSPKVTVEYLPTERSVYYLTYGTSFNPPPLYKIYRTSLNSDRIVNVRPNPGLNPEVTKTWEAGMKYTISDKTRVQLAVYHAKTDDKITYAVLKDATGKSYKQYINEDTAKNDGVEIGITQKFTPKVSGYLNYAYQHAEGKDSIMTYDTAPRHILHTGVAYQDKAFFTALDMEYVSARMAVTEPGGEYGAQDPYTLFNLAMAYNVKPNAKLTFGVDNLFNRHFYASEATAGRTVRVGFNYEF